ncbi:peptide methionine sulfoxide reductase [Anopheles darlingi]|uniref:peptide methionine sulfoxide reductase n=1 Tax=Anopheles darlingi TaxID=43151 RepID=UPI0021005700|nr:peptide methionine sulfoxide reductase [Anopheles darlingi]
MVQSSKLAANNEKLMHVVPNKYKIATFGMGCFWGCDSLFGATKGVLRTRVGYAGGSTKNPSYKNMGDHTEVIEIHYDPEEISYNALLELFWNNHEYGLTKRMKRQYMSLILYHDDYQLAIAKDSLAYELTQRAPEQIVTEIAKAEKFYPAEDYHQKYRLQGHSDLAKAIGLIGSESDSELLQTSHVAARLNGYLIGVGGLEQFESEAPRLGLDTEHIRYVRNYVIENEGGGIFC